MNLIIGCCPCIGKSTLAKKNNIFVDFDWLDPFANITINNKKSALIEILKLKNKIILFNFDKDNNFNFDKDNNFYLLDLYNVKKEIIKRNVKREINKFLTQKKTKIYLEKLERTKKAIYQYIDMVEFKKTNGNSNIIKINNNNDLNNLENILLNIYKKELKNDA